ALEYLEKAENNWVVQAFYIKTEDGLLENDFYITISNSPLPNSNFKQQKKEIEEYVKKHPEKVSKVKGENGEPFEIVEMPMKEEVINGKTYQYYYNQNGEKEYMDEFGPINIEDLNIPPTASLPSNPASAKEVAEYNVWAKKINSKTTNLGNNAKLSPIVEEKKLIKYIGIYNRMTVKQKENAEEMPFKGIELRETESKLSFSNTTNMEDPILLVNGIECDKCKLNLSKDGIKHLTLSTSTKDFIQRFKIKIPGNKTQIINGNKLDINTKSLLKKATIGDNIVVFDITSKNKIGLSSFTIKIVNKTDKNYSNSPEVKKGELSNIPTPPTPPKSPLDHVIDMAKKDASFYYNGAAITSDKAIELVKKNPGLNISSSTNNGVSIVHLSEKGIKTKNGKLVED
ncbi:MAG: hypothetical protein WBF67_02525, partial [Olleya sp.]